MKLIQELSEMIEDEIRGVEEYAKKALEVKEEYPVLADTFYNMSKQEAEHVMKLHEQVARIIVEYRNKKGEPPADMMAVYDYLHKKHIADFADAKRLQDMYQGR